MGLLKEFKEFAVKGNAVDMAVGIVIGAAFGKIVTSLVNDVVMPPLGLLMGGKDFNKLELVMKHAVSDPNNPSVVLQPAVSLRYGAFINNVVDFLIIAACLFLAVKVVNILRATKPPEPKS